jgi:CHASE3 domain sensor protein
MIRKAALQIGAPALLAFMAWNTYLAVNHSTDAENCGAHTGKLHDPGERLRVLKDLTDMETGQRGYLLTEDSSYLQALHGREGQDRNRFFRPSCGVS